MAIAAAIAISALVGAAGSAMQAKESNKPTTTKIDLEPMSTFLPAGALRNAFALAGSEENQLFDEGILNLLQTAANGLPPEVLERMLADISGGRAGAEDAFNRNMAQGFGPLGIPNFDLSQAILSANVRGNVAERSQILQNAATGALMDYLDAVQGRRIQAGGSTVTGPQTSTIGAGLAGLAEGAGAGVDLFAAFQKANNAGGSNIK